LSTSILSFKAKWALLVIESKTYNKKTKQRHSLLSKLNFYLPNAHQYWVFYLNPMTTETLSEIQVGYKSGLGSSKIINDSNAAFDILVTLFPQETICLQEQFVVLYLNRANRVIGSYQLSKGGITGTIADVRLILSVALKTLATGLILAHNHPSGNLKPSEADKQITSKIKQAAKLLDIELIDHIILSINGYYSFKDDENCSMYQSSKTH
jgi:DNA repair protein RadC